MSQTRQAIVITSIFPPTEAVRRLAAKADWTLVVVGDRKTPDPWNADGAEFLSAAAQEALPYRLAPLLPWNHYARKMLGYLRAIECGAEVIWDTDDDNVPNEHWGPLPFDESHVVLFGPRYVNVYAHFTTHRVWPRGYPLARLLDQEQPASRQRRVEVGVWQFLADGDPDVDAIYRLTNNSPVVFDRRAPVVLEAGSACPFNSQSTLLRREVFPLLYLPAHVTFRFTDILRSIVAQPILWKHGYRLGFAAATVVQKRNPHDPMQDFESEVPVYLHTERALEIIDAAVSNSSTRMEDDLRHGYDALARAGITSMDELELIEAWIEDLQELTR